MGRGVKHVQLHWIGSTELRVVSDIDEGVSPIVQAEEMVIRRYMQRVTWPHRRVQLFVLQDLSPLTRQLDLTMLSVPGGTTMIASRPVINLYDLALPERCNVFVNQQAMELAGYWDDLLAVQGLLAHEHAHPLAENRTTHASRSLRTRLAFKPTGSGDGLPQASRLEMLLSELLERLVISAPREIFTNQLTLETGFDQALLHLNRRNVANAGRSLAGRAQLRNLLEQDVASGNRSERVVGQILLGGDLESHLVLAMEIAPFVRAGHDHAARELLRVLEREIFPQLEPQVAPAFAAINRLYSDLSPDLSVEALVAWGQQVAAHLVIALAEHELLVEATVESRYESGA